MAQRGNPYDETMRQQTTDGTPLVKVLTEARIIPRIKVDIGAQEHGRSSRREGHRRSSTDCASGWLEYSQMGARFAKWRAVIGLGRRHSHPRVHPRPTLHVGPLPAFVPGGGLGSHRRAGGAHGRRPHSLDRCREVTEDVLRTVFDQLADPRGCFWKPCSLKPNMVLPGEQLETRNGRSGGRRHC